MQRYLLEWTRVSSVKSHCIPASHLVFLGLALNPQKVVTKEKLKNIDLCFDQTGIFSREFCFPGPKNSQNKSVQMVLLEVQLCTVVNHRHPDPLNKRKRGTVVEELNHGQPLTWTTLHGEHLHICFHVPSHI